MSGDEKSSADPSDPVPPGNEGKFRAFIRLRLREPLLAQLRRGATPERLALSVALSVALSISPLWGSTMLLCFAAGTAFRLNHVAMQLTNQVVSFLQLVLIPVYIRLGERLFGMETRSLNPKTIGQEFMADPRAFFAQYGLAIGAAVVAWILTVPFVVGALYPAVLPGFRRIAARAARRAPPERNLSQ